MESATPTVSWGRVHAWLDECGGSACVPLLLQ